MKPVADSMDEVRAEFRALLAPLSQKVAEWLDRRYGHGPSSNPPTHQQQGDKQQ